MSKFELQFRDEYGSTGIIGRSDDLSKLMSMLKEELFRINIDNPLTQDDKERNWEAYAVVFGDVKDHKVLYGGKPKMNRPVVFAKKKSGEYEEGDFAKYKDKVKIYLGDIGGNPWFAKNLNRKQELNSVDDPDLSNKTVYYFAMVK